MAYVIRLPRHAAVACLAMVLLSQLVLPTMHVVVHALEAHGDHRIHGRQWIVITAGNHGRGNRSHASSGRTLGHASDSLADDHTHGDQRPLATDPVDAPGHSHRHDNDLPGDRHGQRSVEHLAGYFLEVSPPALPPAFHRLAAARVPLSEGQHVLAAAARAHLVRGPPLSG